MSEIKIRDLYTGKPDAKDEINFEGLEEFIKTFVVADHFQLDSLLYGNNCFITGFKGTGKTALLFYLDNKLKDEDPITCTSFIFFKEEFTDAKRDELQAISNRFLSSISVEPGALLNIREFEYIWRWLIFKRIVSDNEDNHRNLFVDDEFWREFERKVNQIKAPLNKKKSIIPSKIKIAVPYKDPATLTELSPEVEVDLGNNKGAPYQSFMLLIDEAEAALAKVNRTDIPYYIFIDELEAYYGNRQIFERDLALIRDLIFTVKRFNTIFAKSHAGKTKIICSVRSEIINAISRFIVTKEINKATSGFSVPLNWIYANTSSYMHPIIQIVLKRIAVCEASEECNYKEVYNRWFPEKIHGIEPANYILNNSWCKPRDMVRLLSTAKNALQNNSKVFSQAVFNSLSKAYSEESLSEIKEELRALYDPAEIETIINCFMGYKTAFSVSQLKKRISTYYAGTVIDTHFNQVIEDLYRLGFLGNFMPISKIYRWQHKGDERVILADEWRLFVHYALHGALSLGARLNFGLTRGEQPETGDVVNAVVQTVIRSFALVEFTHNGESYLGQIHISEFTKLGYGYIRNLSEIVHIDDEYRTALLDYHEKYERWNLQIIPQELE